TQTWPRGLDCALGAAGSSIDRCDPWVGGEPTYLETYAQATALLLVAHGHDPSIDLCAVARPVLDQLAAARSLDGYVGVGAGWFKGSSQAFQGLVHGIGAYEACAAP
ncbi:MAG: hypothetical protein AAFX50_14600, partial [Acidobacteriota bacterium]